MNRMLVLPGLDPRIGHPVWIFKGERKGVAELHAVGTSHAVVYHPGRIQSLSEITLDSAVSRQVSLLVCISARYLCCMSVSVDWKRLDDNQIDEETENCARDAVGKFIGMALPLARARSIPNEGHEGPDALPTGSDVLTTAEEPTECTDTQRAFVNRNALLLTLTGRS